MFEALLSGLSCVLFLSLCAHILFSPRRVSTQGAGLAFSIIIFCLVEAFSGLISAGYTSFEEPLLFAESLLPLTALLFGLTYGRKDPLRGAPLPMKALAALAFVFPASAVLLPYSAFFPAHAYHEILPLGSAGYPFYLGIMFYCIIALFNIEVTFKAVHDPEKWWGENKICMDSARKKTQASPERSASNISAPKASLQKGFSFLAIKIKLRANKVFK